MNLSQIKQQYKHIINDVDDKQQSDSEQEWKQTYIKSKKNNISNNQNINQPYQYSIQYQYLILKQKIAQCLSNINKKNIQIISLKQSIIKLQQVNKFLQIKNLQLLTIIQTKNANIIQEKAAHQITEENLKLTEQNIENQQFDRKLLARQINFYQAQINDLNNKLSDYDISIKQLKKQLKVVKELKDQNTILKNDAKRLKQLLNQTKKYRKLSTQINHKHFIPQKLSQKQNWVSQSLVSDVQKLLKKYSIANNKNFTNSLLHYVNRYSVAQVKKAEQKVQKVYSSRIRQIQRLHNYSFQTNDFQKSCFISQSTKNQQKKKRSKTTLPMFQSSIDSRLSHGIGKDHDGKQLCLKILTQLHQILTTQPNPKHQTYSKIKVMLDWAIQSLSDQLPKQKSRSKPLYKQLPPNLS